ncbi:hypothetical protein NXT3_PB00302 (plasmid) [Sinorhizobium fredii]|uniref:Uncharacterized protein n=1 Tax=Rhizobium fredii TaxID=380 RepID=A0A2L0HBT3_RHIFR|nr:hypothetical protein NXT3_PB00302 [Sinorhizobium fredii]
MLVAQNFYLASVSGNFIFSAQHTASCAKMLRVPKCPLQKIPLLKCFFIRSERLRENWSRNQMQC